MLWPTRAYTELWICPKAPSPLILTFLIRSSRSEQKRPLRRKTQATDVEIETTLEEFLKAHDCNATAADVQEFLNGRDMEELSDDDLVNVARRRDGWQARE